jgi:hypothetical protein
MEEAETASGAAETISVADHKDAEMSQPETNGIAHSDQAQTPQVRTLMKHFECRTLSNKNQELLPSEQPSPGAEAPIPHAAEGLAGAMPQAILGTGMSTTVTAVLSAQSGGTLTALDTLTCPSAR